MVATFDLLADLPLGIDSYSLVGLAEDVSSGIHRQTTVTTVHGDGLDGSSEDVTYDGIDHDRLQDDGPSPDLPTGRMTLGEYCSAIGSIDLFPNKAPEREVSRAYRRWAFDAAGLDLALKQAGRPLHEVLGLEVGRLRFVVSIRLGEPPTLEPVTSRLAIAPDLQFKLDPTADWDEAIVTALASTDAVESVDFKAFYTDSLVEQKGGVELYELVVSALPEALIEDPDLRDPKIREFLEPHRGRITWDAPFHSIGDIESLEWKPRMVNVKPSRLGGLKELLDTYDWLAERGIECYSGGQFELGIGRRQNQLLAAIFHPGSPNDLAPVGWNVTEPAPPLGAGPLDVVPTAAGFDAIVT